MPHKMKIQHITSRSNPRVKDLIKHKEHYLFFEGEKLVKDILRREITVNLLVMAEEKKEKIPLEGKKIKEVWYVNHSVLKKLSSLKEEPGFIAVLQLEEKAVNFHKLKTVIALDGIQDPANAGTVFRCAAAFGIDAVVFSGASVKPGNSKFLRAAQNAFFETPFQHFQTLAALLEKAAEAGLNIYLTSSHDSGGTGTISPDRVKLPCLVLFGNEGRGLPAALFKKYPSIRIAQTGKVESLNVGISACIIMHELKKKRETGGQAA
ncbi:MAG: RNA methyltransferase [bacterium]|nr:RNA methyltransferase [bacterium]